jgi:integrase
MRTGKLTALGIRKLTQPGRYGDGGNLYLNVRPNGSRAWLLRYTIPGQKPREMGLGSLEAISLSEAREMAVEARRLIQVGQDPIQARTAARQAAVGRETTFRDVAGLYIRAHEETWKNEKHRAQWASTLETYAYPVMGALPIDRIEVGEVMKVLEPIWRDKPETASRLRGRIETILDYATARGWRRGDNPARWKGHIDNLLPSRNKASAVQHHAAMPWGECPAFMQSLAGKKGEAALALRFTILTAARTSEVIGATWGEIDLSGKVWTIPGQRMKAGREHRVPLSPSSLSLLRGLHTPDIQPDHYVFPGGKAGSALSNMAMTALLRRMELGHLTVHGFRSSFRDWCSETTSHPRDVAEAALAHTVKDKVEAAYRRGDLFDRRRKMMEEWDAYLSRPPGEGAVVPIRGGRKEGVG